MINTVMVEKSKGLISSLIELYQPDNKNFHSVIGAHDILIAAFGGH